MCALWAIVCQPHLMTLWSFPSCMVKLVIYPMLLESALQSKTMHLSVAKWNFNVQITNSYYGDNSTGFGGNGM